MAGSPDPVTREAQALESSDFARAPGVDSDLAYLLLSLHRDYLGDVEAEPDDRTASGADGWQPGDVAELLLDILPAKVADDGVASAVPDTLRALLRYLHETRRLPRPALRRLLAEVAEVEASFYAAMADPRRGSMATSLVLAMQSEGVDVADPGAVERWMTGFNDRSYEQRVALTGGPPEAPDDLPALPPVVLAPDDELADAVRSTRTWQRLRVLVDWVGVGRRVTETDVLPPRPAVEVAELLGLPAGRAVPTEDEQSGRSAATQLTLGGSRAGRRLRYAAPGS